ncbi:sugar phosphate isomerase/epimerase [Pikeienuella piscinae]|uniref:Sugar phosphate isomerase/epimerase n=1 Tax=Pikeienuella piscinae TaxID=2748098 RepID=A0A7M3T6Y1_9RHOB|nr:sugar phosphate isomerase/epimerase [Pikeienuella piscinae]
MKLSLCNEVVRDLPFDRQCAFAASVGYDGLEIAPFTFSDQPQDLTAVDLAAISKALKAEGLACSSLHWLLVAPEGLSITDPDESVRRRTVEVMRRFVDMAATLGADRLVHGSPKQRNLEPGAEAECRARAVECLAAAAEAAEAAGVIYCIEPLASRETNFINTLAEAAALVAEVDSPGFSTMIDSSAAGFEEGDVPALIDRWLPAGRISHVQVNDPNRRGPGEGDLPMAPILAALRRHDYQGWVAVEPFIYEPDGQACAARAAGYLRGILETMR